MPVTSIQERCFRGFQCFSCAKEENMVLLCLGYGCGDKKDETKGIYIHQICFYCDTRSEAVKRRRKWILFVNGSRKHWTPSKYSVVCSMHRQEDFTRTYSFNQQCYQERLKRDEIGVLPVPRFYRAKVEQEYSTGDRRLHCRSVRFISPLMDEMCALDQSLL